MSWTGNSRIFKTYVPGDGKKPAPGITTKGKDHIATFDEAAKSDSFGAIMQDGYIDISFDDPEMSERFLEMAEANEWRCLVLENPDNKHIHTYWKNEQGGIKKL